jgi:hypothetical protein
MDAGLTGASTTRRSSSRDVEADQAKGLSEPAFEQQYGTEEPCRAIDIASRWPHGFECPVCGGRQYCVVTTRDLYQCAKCRCQTSPIAGTIFASHSPMTSLG